MQVFYSLNILVLEKEFSPSPVYPVYMKLFHK